MITKSKWEREHAKLRAYQRYDLSLNRKDLDAIAKMIQTNHRDAIFLKRQSNRVTLWMIIYRKKSLKAVYDGQRHQVVTFLPWKKNEY